MLTIRGRRAGSLRGLLKDFAVLPDSDEYHDTSSTDTSKKSDRREIHERVVNLVDVNEPLQVVVSSNVSSGGQFGRLYRGQFQIF